MQYVIRDNFQTQPCRTLRPACGKELVLTLKVQLGTEKTSFPAGGAELFRGVGLI